MGGARAETAYGTFYQQAWSRQVAGSMRLRYSDRRGVLITALFLLCADLSHSQPPWRSRLYPIQWEPPTSTPFTEPMLQDWSYAGAFQGRPLPLRTGPVFDAVAYGADLTGTRDSTLAIQSAIDAAGATGGVVYLQAGTYRIQTEPDARLRLPYSNVVVRGAGVGKTFLLNTTTNMRSRIVISIGYASSGGWEDVVGTPVNLSADVLTPTSRIPVESTTGFAIGDKIILSSRLSQAFINEVGMGGVWPEDDVGIRGVAFSRTITNIEPGVITIDVPVRFYLKTRDRARVYHTSPVIENSGIEDLSIGNLQHGGSGFGMRDHRTPGTAAYDVHGSRFIDIHRARNVWLKNISTYRPPQNSKNVHILSNAITIRDASHVTLQKVHVARPEYVGEGGNGYGFAVAGQEVLAQDCSDNRMRHGITFGGMQCSGNVVYRCKIQHSKETPNGGGSDFHRYMSQSNLVDNLVIEADFISARYRPFGSRVRHGITATQTVFYNTEGRSYHPRRDYIIASAQALQGYIIGTSGPASNVIVPLDPRSGERDWLEGEGRGSTLTPVSLYASQVAKRRKLASVARITASSSEPDNSPEQTIDNDLGTRWAAPGTGSWIQYDLGAERTVTAVGLGFYRGEERIAYIQITTSLDGTTWSPPVSFQSSGTTNDTQVFDLADVRARYVRIISLGNSRNESAAITETDIYGL